MVTECLILLKVVCHVEYWLQILVADIFFLGGLPSRCRVESKLPVSGTHVLKKHMHIQYLHIYTCIYIYIYVCVFMHLYVFICVYIMYT